MLVEQLLVLCNVPVIEICYSKIQENVEKERKVKKIKIKSIIHGSNDVLNVPIDGKDPYWFY
jgi:hypothetical protein